MNCIEQSVSVIIVTIKIAMEMENNCIARNNTLVKSEKLAKLCFFIRIFIVLLIIKLKND